MDICIHFPEAAMPTTPTDKEDDNRRCFDESVPIAKNFNKKEAQKAQKRLKALNSPLAQKLDSVIAGRVIEAGKQEIRKKIPKVPKVPGLPF